MGLLSNIFGKKNVTEREGKPDMVYLPNENERMNWAIEKANLTLWYFEESLKAPQAYQSYFSIKVLIIDGDDGEHIWLTEPHFDDEGNLYGTVGNEPVNVKTLKIDQMIGIGRDQISDWMIIENGRLIGGYTIRAIRDGIPDKEKSAFDESVNLYFDEGVDHFKPNLETPEGAILALEKAYSDKNLEQALSCKDFYEEAKMMLVCKMNMEFDEDILKQTAEVLELSFIDNMEQNGFPDFSDLQSGFPEREKITDNHWIITEICWYHDGGSSIQKHNIYKTITGWKVLGLVDDKES